MCSINLSSNPINSMNNERNKTAQCNKTVRGVNNSINIEVKIKRDFMDIDFSRFDGMTASAYRLFFYLREMVNKRSSSDDDRYYIIFDSYSKDKICKELNITNVTLERAARELKNKTILLPVNKGRYIYNFKHYGYNGKKDSFDNLLLYYNIDKRIKENNTND